MTAGVLWLLEFALESLGACLFARRKLFPPAAYLGLRALGDIATFAMRLLAGKSLADWTDFWARTMAYILFWCLSMYVVAKVLRETDKHVVVFYPAMAAIFGGFAVLFFHSQPLTMHRVWMFEMWADMIAGALVCTAMGTEEFSRRTVPAPWPMISLGIFVHSATDGLLCAAQYHGKDVAAYYPVGALIALGIWTWAAWRKIEHRPIVRVPLGYDVPEVTRWLDESAEGTVN